MRLHESNGRRVLMVLGAPAVAGLTPSAGGEWAAADFLGRVLLGLALADAGRDAYLYDRLQLLLQLAEHAVAHGCIVWWCRD